MMFEVVFRTTYNDFYCDISRRFPSLRKFFWCNHENDIVEIAVDDSDEYKPVMGEILSHEPENVIEESTDQQKIHLIVKNCGCGEENGVTKYMDSLEMLHIYPTVTERGWEYHRIVFFRHEDFEELLQRLTVNGFTFEIIRKVPFDGFIGGSLALNADTLLSNLTDKQLEALLTAHRYGYYYLPRKTDVQAIANKTQMPRTTFQEHLKKAENKLITAMIPYIQLFKHSTSEQRRRLVMTVTEEL